MSTGLKLVSINVERDKHWATVLPFLEKESPDVLCMQELLMSDVPKVGYPYHHFVANSQWRQSNGEIETVGVCIFSKTPFAETKSPYYYGDPMQLPVFDPTSPETIRATWFRGIAFVTLQSGEKIATTHFTWTPHGEWEPYQDDDLHAMLTALKPEGEYVLCGDFNVPRGKNAIYDELVKHYTDEIPRSYTGSIDMHSHRTKGTKEEALVATYMVDYLLATRGYDAHNVRLQEEVSDHKAIVATITRT